MPIWNPPAPKNGRGVPFRLLRVPAKGVIKGAITSSEPIAVNTHYVANRTIPCEGPDNCPSCQAGHSFRYHCYTGLVFITTYEHVILELTAAASETLRNYYKLNHATRGILISAHRPSSRHNGRVVVSVGPRTQHVDHLPDEPDLMQILCHIWGIRYDPLQDVKPNFLNRYDLHTPPHDDQDARYRA